jgi:Pyridoxamine 5'-phosphate oxidase
LTSAPKVPEPAKKKLYDFMRARRLAVIATADGEARPEAALIDFAVTEALEIVFETTTATRKIANLRHNPRVALVIGWDGDQTLQYDGLAEEPGGQALERIRACYLSVFPEKTSHQNWPGNCYFLLRPLWIRFSNYYSPRTVEEYDMSDGRAGRPSSSGRNWLSFLKPGRGRT